MRTPLRRAEKVERNRELVLAAARRVFLAKGYAGATLDAIAEEAGFSKGVVYSQFESKGDLFLALLQQRIEERAQENQRIAETTAGTAGVGALFERAEKSFVDDPAWTLLVIEFRVHAARDPQLNRRYAESHARTLDRLAATLSIVHEHAGTEPPLPARMLAELILAIGNGIALERAASRRALPRDALLPIFTQLFGESPMTDQARAAAPRTRARKQR